MDQIFTIGHSTRPIEELVDLLKYQGVTQLVDIRTIPRSRHNPQYQQVSLEATLPKLGIKYVYIKELGGLRSSSRDSVNMAWRNKSFRNYADHMQTEEFESGLNQLINLNEQGRCAIMCAEAVPWRCHRSLVGDALLVKGFKVIDIISSSSVKEHTLTSFAVVDGEKLTYPAEDEGDSEG